MSPRQNLVTGDRVRILLTLVPFLWERGEVPLAEVAEAFEVEPEQMRTMVEKLSVIGRPGDGGQYQHNDLFDIDWDLLDDHDIVRLVQTVEIERAPRLTAREAAALLAGLQLATTIPGLAASEVYAQLSAKLARGAASAPTEVVVASEPVDEARRTVAQAVASRVAVAFTYRAPDAEPTTRTVDPAQVIVTGGDWYLEGWCHLRHATRTFLLDRVSDIHLTDIAITEHGQTPAEEAQGDVATLRFPTALAPLLGDYLRHAEVTDSQGISTAVIRLADAATLKRLVARLGGRAEVVAPAAARRAAADWAARALALYDEE
ncbi:MAG: WYL domain-containing protein [Microbacterium sp.]